MEKTRFELTVDRWIDAKVAEGAFIGRNFMAVSSKLSFLIERLTCRVVQAHAPCQHRGLRHRGGLVRQCLSGAMRNALVKSWLGFG